MNEVEEIKSRLDIVDVIGSYIQLKPAGRNFKALSPFRQEKTPSFMVSPEKKIWHDFGSSEGGDIFSFVMKMEGIDFVQALEMLASKAGVTLAPRRKGSANQANKQKLYDAVAEAVKYYHFTLSKNKKALDYLTKKRGLKTTTIKDYKLGYAPDSWTALTNYLTKKGFGLNDLAQAGLVGLRAGGKTGYDLYRARIMFPIFDGQGRAVGFSARLLADEPKAAKYINTPQTPIYNKSQAIYGLAQAKEAIRKTGKVIVVEGNMDVIRLAQAGQKDVVAVSGTALTLDQLKNLSYLTSEILICFDQDKAGLAATKRAIELAGQINVKLMVIKTPGAKDPDELVKKNPAAWGKAVAKASYGLDYLFDFATSNFDTTSAVGKKQIMQFLLPALKNLASQVEQASYVKKLAEKLEVSESAVVKEIAKDTYYRTSTEQTATRPDSAVEAEATSTLSVQARAEQSVLELALAFTACRASLADIKLDQISNQNRPIFEYLQAHPQATLAHIYKLLPKQSDTVKILTLRGEENYSDVVEHDLLLEAHAQVKRLNKISRDMHRRSVAKDLAEAEAKGDKAARNKLLQTFQEIINEEI